MLAFLVVLKYLPPFVCPYCKPLSYMASSRWRICVITWMPVLRQAEYLSNWSAFTPGISRMTYRKSTVCSERMGDHESSGRGFSPHPLREDDYL